MSARAVAWVALSAAGLSGPGAFGQATTNPATSTNPAGKSEPAAVGVARGGGGAGGGWWNDAVFYEVFVRSFADSTSGPLAGDGIGDLQGLIEKLDYLNDGDPKTTTDLGVTGLWLMPITQSPSYHGYDTTDYYEIESDYGTNEDFKRLMAECRKRGIRVIVDLVLNHCSDEHEWFTGAMASEDDEKRSWFIWNERAPAWRGPWNQQVWHAMDREGGGSRGGKDGDEGMHYYGIFSHKMPDLNFRNSAVSAEMMRVAEFWLKEMDVDGFRLDAIRHLIEEGVIQENTEATRAWLRRFAAHCKQVKPDAFTVGEVWTSSAVSASYVPDQMDSTFDFDLAGGWLNAAMLGEAGRASRAQAVTAMVYPPGHCSTFLTNHDQPRLMTELRRGKAVTGGGGQAGVGAKRDVPTADEATALGRAKVAAALLLLSPGSPFLYYGEEIGMTGDKPDPKIRTPMQWTGELPGVGFTVGTKAWAEANADAEKVNVAAQSNNAGSLWSWYRDLIRLRRDHAALRRGSWRDVHTHHEGVYGFTRRLEETGETLLVVMNLTGRPAEGVKLFTFEPEPFGEVPNPPLAPDKMPTVKLTALLGPAPLPARLGANGGLMGYTPLKAIPAYGVMVMAVGE